MRGCGLSGSINPLDPFKLIDRKQPIQMLQGIRPVQMVDASIQKIKLFKKLSHHKLFIHLCGYHTGKITAGRIPSARMPNTHPAGASFLVFGRHRIQLFINLPKTGKEIIY